MIDKFNFLAAFVGFVASAVTGNWPAVGFALSSMVYIAIVIGRN